MAGAPPLARVAAWQAPLLARGSMEALDRIRIAVEQCEAEGVTVLCCPEAILGGLADWSDDPYSGALPADRLDAVLAPLASRSVTTIVGFTEIADGRLYNSAAVFEGMAVVGVYRKLHPAIHRSVYDAGSHLPVFCAKGLVFGIIICNDSNHPHLAGLAAGQGAAALFVPTNNGLPPAKGGASLVAETRRVDRELAVANGLWVIRADVAGASEGLTSDGSSAVTDPDGEVVAAARLCDADLVVAEIETTPRRRCDLRQRA